jgi:hypothetical protein
MKVQVVSDELGRIISLSVPGDFRGVSGIAKAGVLPRAGQKVHFLDVPPEFEEDSLLELHRKVRVDASGDKATLVPIEHFIEPFLKSD